MRHPVRPEWDWGRRLNAQREAREVGQQSAQIP